jgi:hypothetical protein
MDVVQFVAKKRPLGLEFSDPFLGLPPGYVERMLAKVGGRKIKHLMYLLRLPCGCEDRQQWLNERFPY